MTCFLSEKTPISTRRETCKMVKVYDSALWSLCVLSDATSWRFMSTFGNHNMIYATLPLLELAES